MQKIGPQGSAVLCRTSSPPISWLTLNWVPSRRGNHEATEPQQRDGGQKPPVGAVPRTEGPLVSARTIPVTFLRWLWPRPSQPRP